MRGQYYSHMTNERPVLPPVSDVGGQVGDQVHVSDDEAVLSQQVLQQGLVTRGEEEHLTNKR